MIRVPINEEVFGSVMSFPDLKPGSFPREAWPARSAVTLGPHGLMFPRRIAEKL
jgi:hypothetical protein